MHALLWIFAIIGGGTVLYGGGWVIFHANETPATEIRRFAILAQLEQASTTAHSLSRLTVMSRRQLRATLFELDSYGWATTDSTATTKPRPSLNEVHPSDWFFITDAGRDELNSEHGFNILGRDSTWRQQHAPQKD